MHQAATVLCPTCLLHGWDGVQGGTGLQEEGGIPTVSQVGPAALRDGRVCTLKDGPGCVRSNTLTICGVGAGRTMRPLIADVDVFETIRKEIEL